MNANWSAGDKALCVAKFIGVVRVGGRRVFDAPEIPLPQPNNIYLVTGVHVCPVDGSVNLLLAGWDTIESFAAKKFRKVVTATERATQQEEGLIPHDGFFDGRPDL